MVRVWKILGVLGLCCTVDMHNADDLVLAAETSGKLKEALFHWV
jgi:hypothetical protein